MLLSFSADTSFMYMIAGLCVLKLYQKRHPDINASAYTAYACLAAVIFFSVLGVVRTHTHTVYTTWWTRPGWRLTHAETHIDVSSCLWRVCLQVFGKGNTVFWIVFSVIHILATLLLSTQLYYMGRWRLGKITARNMKSPVLSPWNHNGSILVAVHLTLLWFPFM